jgi:hypothetical protein
MKDGMTLVIVGKVEERGNHFGDPVVQWNRMHKMDLNTLGTGDADLRFCIINVKDG